MESLEEYLGDKVHSTWRGMGVSGWREERSSNRRTPRSQVCGELQLGAIHRDRGPSPERGNCRGRQWSETESQYPLYSSLLHGNFPLGDLEDLVLV